MKIKLSILALIVAFIFAVPVEATQLPKEMKEYLLSQKKVPTIRFDSIIVYSNDVMYLPVLPAYPEKVDKVKIVKTYPNNQSMDSLPDVVVFNNNYSLLKIIRKDANTLTVRNIPELPTEVKTGTIPQDIMVPRGLVLPENLAGILGDVQIPLVGSAKTATFVSTRKTAPLPSGKRVVDNKKYNVPSSLKNKLFFVNNFQTEFLQVFSSTVTEPLYSLKTSGVMKDVKPVLNGKFLLAATKDKKNIDVIDITNEYVAKHIDLTALPSEIAVDDARGKAYVASVSDESLFVIDLATMTMKEKIQLIGAPQRLSISDDGKKIAYLDLKTSNIYVLDLENDYANKLITNYPNTTKLILENNILYLISRTTPKLRIVTFDLLQDNEKTKIKKDKKKEKQKKEEDKAADAEIATNDIYSMIEFDDSLTEDEKEELVGDQLLQSAKTYSTSIKDINIGKKPVDMYEKNGNIYVLCAGDNTVYRYNIASGDLKSDKLPVDGFSKAFSPVPNSNLAVITNMADLKYVVYDMDKEKSVQTLPISEYINTIIILERKDGQ